jgi:hypothetical protein
MLSLLSACAEEPLGMETDMSEANINQVCPADVSEADRANYPTCA